MLDKVIFVSWLISVKVNEFISPSMLILAAMQVYSRKRKTSFGKVSQINAEKSPDKI